MKKETLLILVIAAVLGLTVWGGGNAVAHMSGGGFWQGGMGQMMGNTALSGEMTTLREVMHYSRVETGPTEKGVRITVTGQQESVIAAIKKELGRAEELFTPPFPGRDDPVNLTVKTLDQGVALTFTAETAATVTLLQSSGDWLVHNLFRNRMLSLMAANGITPGNHGPGMMGGGQGFGSHGPGMMGSGQGFGSHGPGMMGGGWRQPEFEE